MFGWNLGETITMALIALLVILMAYSSLSECAKISKGRKKVVNNNSFLKEHIDEMEEVMLESRKLADATMAEFIIILIIAIAVLIGYFQITHKLPIILTFIAITILRYISAKYEINFRTSIIEKIISRYNPKYKYYPNEGLPSEDFEPLYKNKSNYRSLDLVQLEDYFEFAWIKCSSITYNKDYNSEAIHFLGSLGKMKITNLNTEILLNTYAPLTIYPKENNGLKKIKIDDEKFNKFFVIYASSENDVDKILSESMRTTLIMVRETLGFDTEIRVYEDNIYIKLRVGDGISPSLWNSSKERRSIYTYLSALDGTLWACQIIKDKLEQK